jgi:hypothetical protein
MWAAIALSMRDKCCRALRLPSISMHSVWSGPPRGGGVRQQRPQVPQLRLQVPPQRALVPQQRPLWAT